MTGVRPVKLAGELIDRLGYEEARKRLLDYYLLSPEKTALIMDMYEYQVESLGKAPDKSLGIYIGIPFCPTRCLYCSFASNTGSLEEKEKYLPLFRKLFPDFTIGKMDCVHYCRYEWYDGSDAMYMY